MRLSKKFLQDYIDINVDIKTLADDMMRVGNEYETSSKLVDATNLVIGEVIKCEPHPNSSHLHVCLVNIGKEVLQIVCGAPNVKEGLKVIVSLVGAKLPGNIIIKKSVIREVESNGMICSLQELGFDNKFLTEKEKLGIYELPNDAKVGEDPIKYLGYDDEIIDFDLTANRGDLLSILGMAYEVGAIYNKRVKDIDLSYQENDKKNDFNLQIETNNCSLFLARKVENIKIKESPSFIKERLIASGIRPINNVVDISNFVMLETGQPLHFYDSDLLGNKIVVRMAKNNEELVTLDNVKRTLNENDIVITDGNKSVALAGVMGGIDTEINYNTKNILIEAAIFDPIKIRMTSKKVLKSEASIRFEKGLDPNRCYMAVDRCLHLLEKYADAVILKGTSSYDKTIKEDKKIKITVDNINNLLGLNISLDDIVDVFKRLGFKVEIDDNNLTVIIPRRRLDINIKEDLIEEVGRIYGVDKIKEKLPVAEIKSGRVNKINRIIRNKMANLGLNEVITYSLINNKNVRKYTNDNFKEIKILSPLTEERTTLRYSLISSLLDVYEYNKAHNIKDIAIFEIGKSFYEKDNDYLEESILSGLLTGNYYRSIVGNINIDFYIVKGIIEELLSYLGYENRYVIEEGNLSDEYHPGQRAIIKIDNNSIGYLGRIHPSVTKEEVYVFEISLDKLFQNTPKKISYKEISKYPAIAKDVAFIVSKDINSSEIIKIIKKTGGNLLKEVLVFDVYYLSDNERSIAYTLKFESLDRTLTDEEVDTLFRKIISNVTTNFNIKVRDN